MNSPAYSERLAAFNWNRYFRWVPTLEEEARGTALLLLVLAGDCDPRKPLPLTDLSRRLSATREHVVKRLEALEKFGLVQHTVDALNRRFVAVKPLPLAPGEPPPGPIPTGQPVARKVKVLARPAASAPAVPSIPARGRGEPSQRAAWTRWKQKQKTALHWTPDDFLGYWVCSFREVYGYEDPDFLVAMNILDGFRQQARMYPGRFLDGNKERFRQYINFCFEKARTGEMPLDKPLRWGWVVNFRKTGFLASYLAQYEGGATPASTTARRGADVDWSDPDRWKSGETESST